MRSANRLAGAKRIDSKVQLGRKPARSRKSTGRNSPSDSDKMNPFHQILARFTLHQAHQVLGEGGPALIVKGNAIDIDHYKDVSLTADRYTVRFSDGAGVTIVLENARNKKLRVDCTKCGVSCDHMGAAFGHLLENKILFGFSAPPDEKTPLELLTDKELLERVLHERRQRALSERMRVIIPKAEKGGKTQSPWCDYVVTNTKSGKAYRVALRGLERGQSYCSCPDYKTNHLGTCKHIMYVTEKVKKRFSSSQLAKPYRRSNVSLRVSYLEPVGLLFNLPDDAQPNLRKIVGEYGDSAADANTAVRIVRKLEQAGYPVNIYPDAEERIQAELTQQHLREVADEIRKNPAKHPLRKGLLSVELLPYQLDGIAFVVGRGRAILADDMGLGKTIQGIGVAELLARQANIERVLVICPASLKGQWQTEIAKFCDRSAQIVVGGGKERTVQYGNDRFFTICNYEQVVRDLSVVERSKWDLIILDEGQRIKNWQSNVSQIVRSLRSTYALVLSGTPLENRLDELYTVVQFVDDLSLGPAYRFFHQYRQVDDRGKAVGYKNLHLLREALKPILLRRTRSEVAKQLPERTDEVIRIVPTQEQFVMSREYVSLAAQIAAKKFLTEMDLLRLQKALLMARLAANGTYLVDKKKPGFSTKLSVLEDLLTDLIAVPDRKIVLFSEWKVMLDLIEPMLKKLRCKFVRLDGSVPQKYRPSIVRQFQNEPQCRLIMMTNAGSTGLNLQSANTVINVDLPWNPAVLEQRIARAHRMGQQNPVHVYKLVTESTIEERLLDIIASKQELANAAIDFDSEVEFVTMKSSITNIRERLEKILAPHATATPNANQEVLARKEVKEIEEKREKVAMAGGQLLGAALGLLSELVKQKQEHPPQEAVVQKIAESLQDCVERDELGRPQLTVRLENEEALRNLASSLAHLLVGAKA